MLPWLSGCPTPAPEAAEVTPVAPPPSEDEIHAGWASQICADYVDCYGGHNVNGAIDGRLLAVIADDGSVSEVRYTGSAGTPIQDCLVARLGARFIDGYKSSGGLVRCQYSGTYNQGMQILSEGWQYFDGVLGAEAELITAAELAARQGCSGEPSE